ncbi:hypothetical protein Pelo_3081 [Pelomyxa schiedti]|nr:hypothetical protein Pelo_3081 [Pelomyxa schiedti]
MEKSALLDLAGPKGGPENVLGVDLGKARWSTVIHPSIPLVGLPMKVTVTVLHLPDLSGSPIPEFLLIPSLQRLTFTICSDSDNIPSGADSLQFKWRNIPKDASASAEAQIQWVPQTAGRYSINLGSSTIAAVNVQDIDFSKSVISSAPACCNVGSWTAIKIEPKFVTGEKVPEEYFQLLSDLILVRCALLTQEGTVSDNQWNLSQSVVSVSFCLSQPGPHFLYIEGKHKLGQKFIPICGSPVRLLATQVDISKCTIKDFPGYITLNSTSKLQLQLFDQQGQPVDKNQVAQGHIQWKATVGPTPGISPQGQMAASVDSVEHILTLSSQNVGGWCNVSIEGTVDNGATFAHITGSPFVISCAPTVVTVAWDGRNGGYCSITNTGHTVDWTDPGNHSIVSSAREIDVPTYFEVKIERRECCGGIGLAAIDVIKAATNLNVYPHKLPGSPVCYSRNQEGLCHGTEAFKKGITLWDAGSVVGVLVVPHATNGSIRFFLNKQPIGGIANIKTTGLVPVIHMHKGTASSVPDPSLPPDLLFSL